MRVFRGRAETIEADRAASARLLEVAAAGEAAIRVWTPHRQVAFGRRDARRDGFDRAREAARERGFPPVERDVGGRAVAYDGETTLAFARAEPIADLRRGTGERYERLLADLRAALAQLGVSSERGEPPDSFCPGSHSLQVGGERAGPNPSNPSTRPRKLAGVAQRVRGDAAIAAGILVVDRRAALAGVLEAVYDALGVSFDPATVGSVAAAGGPGEPDRVRRALEGALVGDADPAVERVESGG